MTIKRHEKSSPRHSVPESPREFKTKTGPINRYGEIYSALLSLVQN